MDHNKVNKIQPRSKLDESTELRMGFGVWDQIGVTSDMGCNRDIHCLP